MNYWLLKTEPDTFSWDDEVALGAAGGVWDGVRNHQAANFLRAMAVGDRAFFYHTGRERSIVGIVEIVETAFPDPTDATGRFVSVRTRAQTPIARPVSLSTLRSAVDSHPELGEFLLLRQPRLSVMPVTHAQWQTVLALCKTVSPNQS